MACKQALRGALAEGREKASSTVTLICWEKKNGYQKQKKQGANWGLVHTNLDKSEKKRKKLDKMFSIHFNPTSKLHTCMYTVHIAIVLKFS